MKMHIRKLAVLLLAIVWLLPAAAQDSQNIGTLVKITPKKGHDDELIEAITDYHKWIANFDGAMRYNWYRVLTGPDTGDYYAFSGGHKWADFDAEYDWQEKAGEVFMENVWPQIADMDRMMVRTVQDWSHWPEDWAGYTHVQVESWYVHNGHYGAFNTGLNRVAAALIELHGNELDRVLEIWNTDVLERRYAATSLFDLCSEVLGGLLEVAVHLLELAAGDGHA